MYYIYILQSELNDKIYTGSTINLKKRFQEHNGGKVFFTKRYKPWKLLYYEAYQTENLARMREKRLKYNGNAMEELKKRIGYSSFKSAFKVLKSGAGFTLIELSVAIGVLAILFGLVTINLSNVQQKSSINSTVDTVISDMKAQQIKAMVGDTEGGASASSYSVHFDANQYVMFKGSVYLPPDPTNFVVSLPPNLQFTTLTDVVFSQRSGEIGAPTSVTLQNVTSSETKTMQLNKYGVVTAVN